MIVERAMDPDYLSNTYLVAAAEGGEAFFVDAGGPVQPLIDKAQELQARVFRLINNPNAPPEDLRKAREDYEELNKFTARPTKAETIKEYETFKRIMGAVG